MVELLALVKSHVLGLNKCWLLFFVIVKKYKIKIIWMPIRLPYQIFFEVPVKCSIFFE
jgi:hypothetical protein